MSVTDKFIYYGVWGTIFGYSLYYGWRLMLSIVVPGAMVLVGSVLEGREFDPIITGYFLNEILNMVCGLLVGVFVALAIRYILKPKSFISAMIPIVVLLGNGYWWLLAAYIDGSFYPRNFQLLSYITGPIVVGIAFIIMYWLFVVRRPISSSS